MESSQNFERGTHRAWLLAMLGGALLVLSGMAQAGGAASPAKGPTAPTASTAVAGTKVSAAGVDTPYPQLPADDEAEREQLAVIAAELVHLQDLVQRAAERGPAGQRVKFRYDWLARDLQLVRDGVEQHFDAQRQPRLVAPLRGDYRR